MNSFFFHDCNLCTSFFGVLKKPFVDVFQPKRAINLPLSLRCRGRPVIPRPVQSSLNVPLSFLASECRARRIEPSSPCSLAMEHSTPSPSRSSQATTSSVFHFCATYQSQNNPSTMTLEIAMKKKK